MRGFNFPCCMHPDQQEVDAGHRLPILNTYFKREVDVPHRLSMLNAPRSAGSRCPASTTHAAIQNHMAG